MSKFWDKVEKCEHELGEYSDGGACWTPYCSWSEYRCKKCGVYVTSCGCHFEDGMSGWPRRRWMRSKKYDSLLG